MARISYRRSATQEDTNIDIDLEGNEDYTKISGKVFPRIGIVYSRIGMICAMCLEILRWIMSPWNQHKLVADPTDRHFRTVQSWDEPQEDMEWQKANEDQDGCQKIRQEPRRWTRPWSLTRVCIGISHIMISWFVLPLIRCIRWIYISTFYVFQKQCAYLAVCHSEESSFMMRGNTTNSSWLHDDSEEEYESKLDEHSGYFIRRKKKFGRQGGSSSYNDSKKTEMDMTTFTDKNCPVAGSQAPWTLIEKTYNGWLMQTSLPAEAVMNHLKGRGLHKHAYMLRLFKIYEEEHGGKLFMKRRQIVKRRWMRVGGKGKGKGDDYVDAPAFVPTVRDPDRIAVNESPADRQAREDTERAEDEREREIFNREQLENMGEDANNWVLEEESRDAERTGDVDIDFPAWAAFKKWMLQKTRHSNPIQKIRRLNKWLRKKRQNTENILDYIDDWMVQAREVERDALFWTAFGFSIPSTQAMLLLMSLDLPPHFAMDVLKELHIGDEEKMKAIMTVELLREKVEKWVTLPQDYADKGPSPADKIHFADGWEVAPDQMSLYSSSWQRQDAYSAPQMSNWTQGWSATPAVPSVYAAAPAYTATHQDEDLMEHYAGDELGFMTDGVVYNQQDGTIGSTVMLACFWSSNVNDWVFYDHQVCVYLAKDQCAACGETGHFWRDCTKGERDFPGKPNKPKVVLKKKMTGKVHFVDFDQIDEIFKSKGFKGGRKGGKKKGAQKGGFSAAETEMEEVEEFVWEDDFSLASKGFKGGGKWRKKKFFRPKFGGSGQGKGKGYSVYPSVSPYANMVTTATTPGPENVTGIQGWNYSNMVEEVPPVAIPQELLDLLPLGVPKHLLEEFGVHTCSNCRNEKLAGKLFCVCADNSLYYQKHAHNLEARKLFRSAMCLENCRSVGKVVNKMFADSQPFVEFSNSTSAEASRRFLSLMSQGMPVNPYERPARARPRMNDVGVNTNRISSWCSSLAGEMEQADPSGVTLQILPREDFPPETSKNVDFDEELNEEYAISPTQVVTDPRSTLQRVNEGQLNQFEIGTDRSAPLLGAYRCGTEGHFRTSSPKSAAKAGTGLKSGFLLGETKKKKRPDRQ